MTKRAVSATVDERAESFVSRLEKERLDYDLEEKDTLKALRLEKKDIEKPADIDRLILSTEIKESALELRKISFFTAANVLAILSERRRRKISAFDALVISLLNKNFDIKRLTIEIEDFFIFLMKNSESGEYAIRSFLNELTQVFEYYFNQEESEFENFD